MARFVDPKIKLIAWRRLKQDQQYDQPKVHAVFRNEYDVTMCGRLVPVNQFPTWELRIVSDDDGLCHWCRNAINREKSFRQMEEQVEAKRNR